MPILLTALASALLLAAIVTELYTRFMPNDYWLLALISTIALLVNGLFNARLALRGNTSEAPPKPARSEQREKSDRPARGGNNQKRSQNRDGRNDRKAQPRQNNKQDAPRRESPKPVSAGEGETGTVKWFNRSKGYGFVIRENGEEIFVHQRSIVSSGDKRPVLRDGQQVRFAVSKHEKGDQAENVEPLD